MDHEQYHRRRRRCRRRRRRRIVSSLPNDIVRDILLRLPATILLKFKCICKSWFSAITDPRFIASHTDRMVNSPSSTLLLFRINYRDFRLYDYRLGTSKTLRLRDVFPGAKHHHPEDIPRNDTIPSVNGLLLLQATRLNHVPKPYTRVYICNPCTREIVPLPVLDVRLDSFRLLGGIEITYPLIQIGILKNPQRIFQSLTEKFWFGVDPSTGKYKVVQFMDKIATRPSLCHVFTQGGDCWREVAHCPPFVRLTKFPVSLKGALYGMTDMDNSSDGAILSFNLMEERLTVFPIPPHLKGVEVGTLFGRGTKTMAVLQGRLSVVDCFTAEKQIILDIWILNNEPNNHNDNIIKRGCGDGDGGGARKYEWSKVNSFGIDCFDIPMPPPPGHLRNSWIKRITPTRDGKFLISTYEETLLCFDPKTKSITRLLARREVGDNRKLTSFLHGTLDVDLLAFSTPYTETMAPAG